MSTEEYYHVFESILYAAIVTMIIQGWARMVMQKGQYTFYWGYLAYTINALISVVYKYVVFRNFVFYDLINTPFDFLFIIFLPTGILVLSIYILIPESYIGIDLKEFLIKYRWWIFLSPILWAAANLFHAHHTTGLSIIVIVSNLLMVVAYLLFILTKKLRIIEAVMIFSVFGWPYHLLQDLSTFDL